MGKSPTKNPPGNFPWHPRLNDLFGIVGLFALTRIVLVIVGMVAWQHQVTPSNWRGKDQQTGIRYFLVPDQPFLDMWTRWDSWEYEEIARVGYWYDFNAKPNPYGTVACFPLYPLMTRLCGIVLGGRFVLAGLFVSNLSAIVGFVILFQWAFWWSDRRAAWLTVAAAIAFPSGVFWSALYPQSLFFALSVASLALMLDGRVAVSCLVAGLATASRLEAVAIIPALILIRLSQRGWRVGREGLWFLLAPLGLLGYMAYLQARWGDPLLFLKVHAIFGRGMKNPLETLWTPLMSGAEFQDMTILGTYGVLLVLSMGWLTRVRWTILLYGWILFLIPLTSGVFMSIYRVHLVNVTLYLAIGSGFRGWSRILGWVLVLFFLYLQCLMMFGWANGYFLP